MLLTKKEYITNQIKKTFGKKYENYVVTRIYSLINNSDVQIVTQKMFKRGNNKIALADLYFPQFNIWVEIDENYHSSDSQKIADENRKKEILINNKIKRLEEIVNISELTEPYRIKVGEEQSLEDINKQINELVDIIKNKITKIDFIPWKCNYPQPKEYMDKSIKYEDDIKFHTIQECMQLFEKTNDKYKVCCAWFNIKDDTYLWCPKLKLEDYDFQNCNWQNTISKDGTKIFESPQNDNDIEIDADSLNWDEKRITFAYYKDENDIFMYKFRGVFKLAAVKGNTRVWERESTEVDLSQF